jgi:hypothetical protein
VTAEKPADGEPSTPKYQTLIRSEARLRDDQVADLGTLRRQVAAQRTTKGERITDNTLIRIAVDLLLANGEHLRGNTEEELRQSLLGPVRLPKKRRTS